MTPPRRGIVGRAAPIYERGMPARNEDRHGMVPDKAPAALLEADVRLPREIAVEAVRRGDG